MNDHEEYDPNWAKKLRHEDWCLFVAKHLYLFIKDAIQRKDIFVYVFGGPKSVRNCPDTRHEIVVKVDKVENKWWHAPKPNLFLEEMERRANQVVAEIVKKREYKDKVYIAYDEVKTIRETLAASKWDGPVVVRITYYLSREYMKFR